MLPKNDELICAWGMKPLIFIFTVLLLFSKTLYAQDEPLSSKRVYPVSLPIEVSNTVGRTLIDTYVVHLKKVRNFTFRSKTKPMVLKSILIPFLPEQKQDSEAIHLKIAGAGWYPSLVTTKFGSQLIRLLTTNYWFT